MGPFPVSVDGYTYVISFTDAYSRFSCCYFLKTKDEAPSALRSVIDYFKREGFVIKKLRTDQGGEFLGGREKDEAQFKRDAALEKAFAKICGEHGIVHELTPAHRPEIHGLAERWNKTVMRMANSMLFAARLSHILWPAAVAHANAIRNRLPVRGLGRYTPYELFFKQRPRLGDFKVFGCDAYKLLPTYPKVPGQMARKRLIFVGFTPDRLGYRCFDPIEFRFTTEFELVFDEQSAKKRINALREYDIRRELQRRGQLHDLPLEGNDFDPNDTSGAAAQDSERRIFHQSSLRPDSGTEGGRRLMDGSLDQRVMHVLLNQRNRHASPAPQSNDLNTPSIETLTRRVRPPMMTSVLWDAKTRLHQIVWPPMTRVRAPTNQCHNRMMNRLLYPLSTAFVFLGLLMLGPVNLLRFLATLELIKNIHLMLTRSTKLSYQSKITQIQA